MYNILFKTHHIFRQNANYFSLKDYKNEMQILMQIDIGIRFDVIIE